MSFSPLPPSYLAVLHELLFEHRTAGLLGLELFQHTVFVSLPKTLVSLPALDVTVHALDGGLDGLAQLQHGFDDLQ